MTATLTRPSSCAPAPSSSTIFPVISSSKRKEVYFVPERIRLIEQIQADELILAKLNQGKSSIQSERLERHTREHRIALYLLLRRNYPRH